MAKHGTLLWFDVEQRYKTIKCFEEVMQMSLWFDVEQRYKTIRLWAIANIDMLWFDVEQRYKTISNAANANNNGVWFDEKRKGSPLRALLLTLKSNIMKTQKKTSVITTYMIL